MPGELKYNFLRRESSGKQNDGTKKGFTEQLNDYWKTPEPGQESKPLVSDYKPTPDLLNFYKKKPVPTQTYVPQPKANVTIQDSKENVVPVELQDKDIDDKDPVVRGEEVLDEINSLIVHLEEITKRPRSLPPDINIFHLWKSLQIANELNQQLKDEITVDNAPFPNKAELDKREEKGGQIPPKPIDLDKLFTPAPDSDDLILKDRKLYTSSSFYSPNHPTLEDQVNLARSISKSLTDISNHESKGQSMYVNRKKRSVKWVHEGEGKNPNLPIPNNSESPSPSKQLLKLVTDPRGQVQDIRVLKKQGYSPEPCLSPEICFDLVRDLNGPKGKGAELFAKRRKKSEKWIVEEKNVKTNPSSGFGGIPPPSPPAHLSNKLPPPPPSFLTGNTQRVEQVQKMNEVQERLSQPRVRLIKSPWEAALQTGSVDTAFADVEPRGFVVAPTPSTFEHIQRGTTPVPSSLPPTPGPINPGNWPRSNRDVYKPKIPRGWASPQTPLFNSNSPVSQFAPSYGNQSYVTEETPRLEKLFKGSPRSPVTIINKPPTPFDVNSLLTFTTEEPPQPPPTTFVSQATVAKPPVSKMNSYAVNKDNIQKYGDVISEIKLKNGANKRLPSQKVEMKQPCNTWFKIEPQPKNQAQVPKSITQPSEIQKPAPEKINVEITNNTGTTGRVPMGDQNKYLDTSQSNPSLDNPSNHITPAPTFPIIETKIEEMESSATKEIEVQNISSRSEQIMNQIDSNLEFQRVEELAHTQFKQLESEITSEEYLSKSMESKEFEMSQTECTKSEEVESFQEQTLSLENSTNFQSFQESQLTENKEFDLITKTQCQNICEIKQMEENFEKIVESNNAQIETSTSEQRDLKTEMNSALTVNNEFEKLTSDLKPQDYHDSISKNTVWQPPIITTTKYLAKTNELNSLQYESIESSVKTENITEQSYSAQSITTETPNSRYSFHENPDANQMKTNQSSQPLPFTTNMENNGVKPETINSVVYQNNNTLLNVNNLQEKYLFDEPPQTTEIRDNSYNSTVNYSSRSYAPTMFQSSTPTYFFSAFPTASSPVDFVDLPVNNYGFQTASSPIETSEVFEFPTYGSFNKFEPSTFQSYHTQKEHSSLQQIETRDKYVDYCQSSKITQAFENQVNNPYLSNTLINSDNVKSSTGLKSADLLLSSSFKDVSSNLQTSNKVEKVIKLDSNDDSSKYSEIAKNINIDFKPVERAHVKEVGHEYLNTPRPQSIALDEEVRGLCEKSYVSAYEYQVYEDDKSSSVASITETSKYGSGKTNGEQSICSNQSLPNGFSNGNYSSTKKPASLVPGAVPIFGGAILGFKPNEAPKLQKKIISTTEDSKRPFYEINDHSNFTSQFAAPVSTSVEELIPDYMKKPIESKPPHMIPHKQIMKIRQEEIEQPKKQQNKYETHDHERSLASKYLNLSEDMNEDYESIPVKSLIDCFEQTTRPVMKFKHVQEQLPPKHGVHTNGMSEGGFQPYSKAEKTDTVFVCNTTTQQKYFNASQSSSYQEPTGYTLEPDYTPTRKIAQPYRDYNTVPLHQNAEENEMVIQTEEDRRRIHEENKKIVHEIEEKKSVLTTTTNAFYTKIEGDPESSNAPAPPPRQYRPISIDFSNLSNYNTAPRGWGRNMHVYKPVHLDMKPPRMSATPTFTDF